ncbi:hypothetical protein [Sphingobium yanoikuyae]|uniref:Uncharacterized protein n=1 Tax=Sphingobium yanoikuyae TaxID=13690 RepID=A0A430BZ71_SPHYA|nr:hypothetical protein [Sphingobium yanoikuyae]RSU57990.1 hypothetical protein DAH51_07030 [Sphingobium yanoikuyae]
MTTKPNEPEALERAAEAIARVLGIDIHEQCGDPDGENHGCDSSTCPGALTEDHDAEEHRERIYRMADAALQSDAAATAKLQDRIDELTNEAKIFDEEHADQNRMVDRIADLIGLPQDQELDTVAFELWISAQTAAAAANDAEIARLREVLSAINAEANAATSSDGKERDPWAIGRIAKWSGAALSEAREAG